jgi:hypothetical protein
MWFRLSPIPGNPCCASQDHSLALAGSRVPPQRPTATLAAAVSRAVGHGRGSGHRHRLPPVCICGDALPLRPAGRSAMTVRTAQAPTAGVE